jgi:uncharacterized delta-60 repeat protein
MASIATVAALLLVLAAAPARSLGERREGNASTQVASASHAYARALAIQTDGKLVAVGSSDAAGRTGGFALARYTRKGSLDGSFGRGGKVLTNFGSSGGAAAVVIQPDGKIVAVGSSSRSADRRDKEFALARYRRDGSLDASFGSGGKVLTTFGRYSRAVGVVLQGDGKLVAVGSSGNDPYADGQLAVARYTPSGRLDASFGRGGKVLMGCGSGCYASAVAIQPDGKIVVADVNSRTALVRFNVDGTLDPTFGQGGKVSADYAPFALAIQADGKLVAGGSGEGTSGNGDGDFALTRYIPDGSPDPSFGSGATVSTDFGYSDDAAQAVAIQADGKPVAVGRSDDQGGHPIGTIGEDVAIARYTPAGRRDPSFGRQGKVVTSFDPNGKYYSGFSAASGVVIQPDGRIVAAGYRAPGVHPRDFLLLRYTAQGRLDGGFGSGGKVTTNFGSR